MTPAEYIQLKAYARVDGALLTLVWVASFACYIIGMETPVLMVLGLIIAVWSVFFTWKRTRKFRDEALGGTISFRRAYGHAILTFFYAAILFAIAQYIYFAFIDGGYILAHVRAMATSEGYSLVLSQYGMKEMLEENIAAMGALRPIDYAINYLSVNICVGLVLGLPIATVCRKIKDEDGHISNSSSVQ